MITALKKAVRGTAYAAEWYAKLGSMFRIYPVREKIHALVANALHALVRRAQEAADYFARKRGRKPIRLPCR